MRFTVSDSDENAAIEGAFHFIEESKDYINLRFQNNLGIFVSYLNNKNPVSFSEMDF
jgi:hypothetical protein